MAASRLTIYNGATTVHLGEVPLSSLTENRPVRYALDDVWDRDGVIRCLEQGYWNHAIRTVRIDYEPSITPDFGYQRAFAIPDDWIRTAALCSDERFRSPLREYQVGGGYWWADLDQLYVRYVSSDNQYGLDYSKWPTKFTAFVEGWFALQVTNVSTWQEKKKQVEVDVDRLLKLALGSDAMEQPALPLPRGSWARARMGSSDNDLGRTDRLIG